MKRVLFGTVVGFVGFPLFCLKFPNAIDNVLRRAEEKWSS